MAATAYDLDTLMREPDETLKAEGWWDVSDIAEHFGYSSDQAVFNVLAANPQIVTSMYRKIRLISIKSFEDWYNNDRYKRNTDK